MNQYDMYYCLDSALAHNTMKMLRRLALENRTIIASLHQPSSEVFDLLDRVMVLCAGHKVYEGEVSRLSSYLQSIGYFCPKYTNLADYMLQLLSEKGKGDYFIEQWSKHPMNPYSEAYLNELLSRTKQVADASAKVKDSQSERMAAEFRASIGSISSSPRKRGMSRRQSDMLNARVQQMKLRLSQSLPQLQPQEVVLLEAAHEDISMDDMKRKETEKKEEEEENEEEKTRSTKRGGSGSGSGVGNKANIKHVALLSTQTFSVNVTEKKSTAPLWLQMRVLFVRFVKMSLRNKMISRQRLFQAVFFTIVIGLVWLRLKNIESFDSKVKEDRNAGDRCVTF